MRTIERTTSFKRDYKRAHRTTLDADLTKAIKALAQDWPLAERYRDHPLTADWKDHRDCHLKLDLILW